MDIELLAQFQEIVSLEAKTNTTKQLNTAFVDTLDIDANFPIAQPSPAPPSFVDDFRMDLDAFNEHINQGNIAALGGLAGITVFAWVEFDVMVANQTIMAKWTFNTSGSLAIQTSSFGSRDIQFFIAEVLNSGGGRWGRTTSQPLTVNVEALVVGVFDGPAVGQANQMQIYVNNVNEALTFGGAFPAALTTSTATVNWGRFGGILTRLMDGKINDAGIFTIPLNAAEAGEIWGGGTKIDITTHSRAASLVPLNEMGDGADFNITVPTEWFMPDASGSGESGQSVNMEVEDRVAS